MRRSHGRRNRNCAIGPSCRLPRSRAELCANRTWSRSAERPAHQPRHDRRRRTGRPWRWSRGEKSRATHDDPTARSARRNERAGDIHDERQSGVPGGSRRDQRYMTVAGSCQRAADDARRGSSMAPRSRARCESPRPGDVRRHPRDARARSWRRRRSARADRRRRAARRSGCPRSRATCAASVVNGNARMAQRGTSDEIERDQAEVTGLEDEVHRLERGQRARRDHRCRRSPRAAANQHRAPRRGRQTIRIEPIARIDQRDRFAASRRGGQRMAQQRRPPRRARARRSPTDARAASPPPSAASMAGTPVCARVLASLARPRRGGRQRDIELAGPQQRFEMGEGGHGEG